MEDRIPWYRSLSAPSQVLLMVFLGLCLLFGVGLFRQLREYMANRVVYQQRLERLETLEARRNYLKDLATDIDRQKEEIVREGMGVRPGDVRIQIEPTAEELEQARSAAQPDQAPVWAQWRDLFFPED